MLFPVSEKRENSERTYLELHWRSQIGHKGDINGGSSSTAPDRRGHTRVAIHLHVRCWMSDIYSSFTSEFPLRHALDV